MRNSIGSFLSAFVLAACCAAPTASADRPVQIAPPGPCAEARETVAYVAPQAPIGGGTGADAQTSEADEPALPPVGTAGPDGAGDETRSAGLPPIPDGRTGGPGGTRFSVVGPPQDLFSPIDVAAATQPVPLTRFKDDYARPSPAPGARPGPCESGGLCGTLPTQPGGNPPIIAGGRPLE